MIMTDSVAVSNSSKLDPDSYSNLLYKFAWLVEIIVVIAGFMISIIVGIDAFNKTTVYTEPNASTYLNSVIAFIPFFLVSVVELTKIPVAGAIFYTSSKVWKIILSFMLLCLVVVTFETSLNGFQRNYSQRTEVIQKRREMVVPVELELLRIKNEKQTLLETTIKTIEENFNIRNKELQESRDKQINPIWNEITRIRSLGHDSRVKSIEKELTRQEENITEMNSESAFEQNRIYEEYNRAIQNIQNASRVKREQITSTIDRLADELETLKHSKKDESTSSTVSSLINTFNLQNDEIDEKVSEIKLYRKKLFDLKSPDDLIKEERFRYQNRKDTAQLRFKELKEGIYSKIDTLNNKKSELLSVTHEGHKGRIKTLEDQIATFDLSFNNQKAKNSLERQNEISRLNIKVKRIDAIDAEVNKLEQTKNDLKSEINKAANGDQIYQIAKMIFPSAKTAADITSSQAGIVAIIWFGSLAFIVAVTGILLAFASFVISKESDFSLERNRLTSFRKLNNSIRYFFIARRKAVIEPKLKEVIIEKEIPVEVIKEVIVKKVVATEVIKEVPVDKVVFKEVVRDVVKKQLVHVPMYTNDMSLVQKDLFVDKNSTEE